MDKKLIDYEGFEAYANGVKDKYAEKKNIITAEERRHLKFAHDGYERVYLQELNILFDNLTVFICDNPQFVLAPLFDNWKKWAKDNGYDTNKIIASEQYKTYGCAGVWQKYMSDYPEMSIKSDNGETPTPNELGKMENNSSEPIWVWVPKSLTQELHHRYASQNTLEIVDSKFVKKDGSKQLSTNDYTNEAKSKVDAIPHNPKYTDTIQDLSGYVTKDVLTNYKLEDGTIKNYNAILDRNKNMNSHDAETCIVNMKINNESTREYLVKTYKTKYFTAQVAYSLITPFKIYKRKGLGDQWEDWEELQVAQSFDDYTLFFNKELQKCATKSELPTKLSQLDNDKTFKTETEIQSMIEKASSLKKEVVTSLPTTGKDDVIYLVKDDKGQENNNYLEYLWLNGKYELIGSTQVDLSGYAKLDDIVASKIIDKYVLTKDFRTALNNDQDFLKAIKRDMFTLVIFDGSTSDELVEQAGFESILYYKGQPIGICLVPTGDVISPDFVKQNQFKPNETYITSDLMKDYNQVIQEQFVELQSSLKQYVKNCLNRKLNVADIREFTQQELEEAFR